MKLFTWSWARVALVSVTLLAVVAAGRWWYVHRLGLPLDQARNSLPAGVVGCWALYDGEGRRAGRSFYQSPSIVNLKAEPNTLAASHGSGTVRRAVRLDSLGNLMDTDSTRPGLDLRRFTHWAADSTASRLRVRFSTGLSGTQFLFGLPQGGISKDTISGRAISHWDFRLFNTAEGSVYGVRVSCPE